MSTNCPPAWLADAVLYQVYVQSFADGDADGIGDLRGLLHRLGYLQWLGVNTIWLNPCFLSPFRDAGYDVADYLRIAPRYGTLDDFDALIEAARRRGIRVLLDLVAGHTSDQHPWFQTSADNPDDHRYIWAPTPQNGFVAAPAGSGRGFYRKNFLACQPALNYGYGRPHPDEPWRQPVDAPGPQQNLAALRETMAYWLDRGVAGFRCDMAYSLVKDDPDHVATGQLWTRLRHWLDRRYPDAALLAEWGQPDVSVPAGFHADFFLHFNGTAWRSLFDTGGGIRWASAPQLAPYAHPDGGGSPQPFIDTWRAAATTLAGRGYSVLPSANHDFSRLACTPRTDQMVKAAFAFLLTWPSLPAIYYGDEIGMRFLPDMPAEEGSDLGPRNNRAGSRSPMQWDATTNCGFSTAAPDQLYLPVDPDPARPTVATQQHDDTSVLHLVRNLITLRREHHEFGPTGQLDVLASGYPLAYLRGGRFLVVVNPRRQPGSVTAPAGRLRLLLGQRVTVQSGVARVGDHGYGVFEVDPPTTSTGTTIDRGSELDAA